MTRVQSTPAWVLTQRLEARAEKAVTVTTFSSEGRASASDFSGARRQGSGTRGSTSLRIGNMRESKMASALRIFVLADTHDKLPASLENLAAGADEIWHLGDVCAPSVLRIIETFGPPVTVV